MVKSLHVSSYSIIGKSIMFGAIGGFVAGLVMAPFIMITAILAGMPPDTMLIAMGSMFDPSSSKDIARMVGFGMHMLTSVLIGIIFGAVISLVKKFWITGFGKGIIEGLITGIIAFVILFIPISMGAMPPILMKMAMQMNPTMTEQQIMGMMQQNMPMMMGMGILEHLVYGAVLGAVTTALILKTGMRRRGQEQQEQQDMKEK
jgi:TM2 domain-containing membrane protein YozV